MLHVPLQYDDLSQLSWDCLTVTSHTSIVQVSLILHAAKQLVAMQPHKYHLLAPKSPLMWASICLYVFPLASVDTLTFSKSLHVNIVNVWVGTLIDILYGVMKR